jgi:hypothetical protein
VGPWNVSDYLFPVLVEKGRIFLGLDARQEIPEHSSLRSEVSEYNLKTADNGGKYSAISEEIGMEPLGNQKGRAH